MDLTQAQRQQVIDELIEFAALLGNQEPVKGHTGGMMMADTINRSFIEGEDLRRLLVEIGRAHV